MTEIYRSTIGGGSGPLYWASLAEGVIRFDTLVLMNR